MNRVAAIQMTSGLDLQENLAQAKDLLAKAAAQHTSLAVLPEMFAVMGMDQMAKLKVKESLGHGPIQDFLAAQAKNHKMWIVGGTIPIASSDENRIYNACLVYNDQGELVKHYYKIHLFDVSVSDNINTYQESKNVMPGIKPVCVDTPIGRVGLAVCYDLRFPELFRNLLQQGAEIFAIPSAFTVPTGRAHWELLVKARAVENLSYIIGASQTGTHPGGRKTYGHSLIVNPWGDVCARIESEPGVITADIDHAYQKTLRQDFPVQEHFRLL